MSVPTTMKAIGFTRSLPISDEQSLFEYDTQVPTPGDYDLQVKVNAVSINPVDAKIRCRAAADKVLETPRVVGYDAVGIVAAVGDKVDGFAPGDRVYYAGDVTRQGSHAEYQLVDARIASHAPHSLTDPQAAVMPLTVLTAWEALFDRLRITPSEKKSLLIIGGAGGVGSIAIQLAKQLTHLTVIATASRPETQAWVREMGADHVVDHRDLVHSMKAQGLETVDYIFNVADTKGHWDAMAELIAPQGMIASIVEFDGGVDLSKLQGKSAGFIWELMFTRTLFKTDDMAKQRDILFQVANLIDAGRIRSTLTDTIEGFGAEQLRQAHELIESGRAIGKIAVNFD